MGPSRWDLTLPRAGDGELIGLGADLAPATLVDAYRKGVFPWPHEAMELPWFSPEHRAVIDPSSLHVSRSLARLVRRSRWLTTMDRALPAVVQGCARRPADDGTWITPEMAQAYMRLADLGWAHSLEVWDGEELIGGVYGVAVGRCFTAESMFHRVTAASKVALVDLARRWFAAGGAVIDAQLPTAHLESMGAVTMARQKFLALLVSIRDHPVLPEGGALPVSRLVRQDPGAPPPTPVPHRGSR